MKFRIRRFGVVSTANVAAMIYLLITLVFVIPFALILWAAGPVTTTDGFGNTTSVSIPPVFVLLIPLLYAGIGWLFTALFCLIYNLAARFTGGAEFQLDGTPSQAPVAPPAPAG